jgi:acetyl-CoA acyltransferase 1
MASINCKESLTRNVSTIKLSFTKTHYPSMVERINQMNSQFRAQSSATFNNAKGFAPKQDTDVVIIGLARTAMTRAKKGAQRNTGAEAMLKPVLEAVAAQAKIDKAMVEDIVIGNVL